MLALTTLLIVGASAQTTAKYKVTGMVKDADTGEPVSFSTIIIKDTAMKNITATYASDRGNFEFKLPSGKYIVVTGFTGYTPDTMKMTVGAQNVDLGEIKIKEGVEAGSIQVIGQLVTSDIDKTTYNLASDPETPALTALEMMRKVPLLTVDGEDNIQLKGQSDYKILVNGKPSTMMSKNYKDVLKSMPASSIKSIEVITNPPAKYDAEGLGGLINIVTNRKISGGYNGSVNLGVDQWGSVNGGGYVTAQIGKFALSANLYVGQYKSPSTGSTSKHIDSLSVDRRLTDRESSGWYKGTNTGLNLEASYEIDSLNLITLAVGGNLGGNNNYGDGLNNIYNANNMLFQAYGRRNYGRGNYGYIGGNLDYQHTFKKPDETLTVSYKLDYNPDNSYNESEVYDILNYTDTYFRRSSNDAYSAEHTLQVDYFNPLTKIHQIEAGVKYLLRPNYSNTNNEIKQGEEWVDDNRLKNDLDYYQHVGSFYGGYSLKLKKFSAKAGVRGEFTINDGQVKMAQSTIPIYAQYFNIVPYLTVNFKIDDANSIRLGYTQRLRRPSIWNLNPYVNDLDPLYVTTGNPDLEASLNHNVNFSYSLYKQKWNINFGVSAYVTDNSIESISTLNNPLYPGRIFSRPENGGHRESYRFNFGGSVRLFGGKASISLNASTDYSIVDAPKANLKNSGWSWNGSGYINAQPWKDGNITIYGGLFSPGVNLQNTYSLYYYNGISVSQWILKKKFNISVSCQDPFETKRYNSYTQWGPGYSSSGDSWRYGRSVRLSLQWKFGKMQEAQVKRARRGISNDDGGGAAGGGSSSSGGGGGGK